MGKIIETYNRKQSGERKIILGMIEYMIRRLDMLSLQSFKRYSGVNKFKELKLKPDRELWVIFIDLWDNGFKDGDDPNRPAMKQMLKWIEGKLMADRIVVAM